MAVALSVMLVISLSLLAVANYCGVGFTSDSWLYLEIADQIREKGLMNAEDLKVKPPGYPLLLVWFGSKGILSINFICFTATLFMLFWFGTQLTARRLRWLYFAFVIVSTPLYLVHSFAWTEPPFIMLLLLVFVLLYRYQQDRQIWYIAVAVILLLLLPLVRFAAVFMLLPFFIVVFFNLSTRGRWIFGAVLVVALLFFSVWVWYFQEGFHRRWMVFSAPLLSGNFSRYASNMASYLEALSLWVIPFPVGRSTRLIVAVIVLFLIAAGAARYFLNRREILCSIPFVFLIYYFSLHTVFEVKYCSSERYLTPFYNLLILWGFFLLDQKYSNIARWRRKVILVIIGWLLLYGAVRTVKNVIFWHDIRCAEQGTADSADIIKASPYK